MSALSMKTLAERREVARQVIEPVLTGIRDRKVAGEYARLASGPDGCVHTFLSPDTASFRFSSSSSPLYKFSTNLQNLAKKVSKLDPLYRTRDVIAPADGMVLLAGDYCLAPETKVLTADLRWPTAAELRVGDELIGFDEERPKGKGKRRRLRRAHVLRVGRARLPSYRVVTDKGTVQASAQHKWLKDHVGRYSWVETGQLKIGHRLQFLAAPWEEARSYGAGRIRGFIEGEGWLSGGAGKRGTGLGYSQKPGRLLDEINTLVSQYGFVVSESRNASNTVCHEILGGRPEQMRFLGMFRPSRLDWTKTWEDRALGGSAGAWATVLSIEALGEQDVVTIETSTKTLIAEGILSHNSGAEAIGVAAYSKDWDYLDKLLAGLDTHTELAIAFWGSCDPLKRDIAKTIKYASSYVAKVPTVTANLNKEAERLGKYFTQEEVFGYLQTLYTIHPLQRWWQEIREELAESEGAMRNCFGYRRTFHDPNPDNRLKDAASFLAQSTVAWLMNSSIAPVFEQVDEPGKRELLHQIHDELLFQCYESEIQFIIDTASPILEHKFVVHGRELYIPVEWKFGQSWGNMKVIARKAA